jgi:hypothetical protein
MEFIICVLSEQYASIVGKALASISMKVQQIIGFRSKHSLWMVMETSDQCTLNKYDAFSFSSLKY